MDCLRSFAFRVNTNGNVTGGALATWISGGQHGWSVSIGTTSTYNIQGFKNVNVYGITMLGTIQCLIAGGNNALINEWNIDVLVDGQQPLVGGTATASPNYYSISPTDPTNNVFTLSRFNNSFLLASPIESVKNIQLQTTFAQGFANQNLTTVNIYWNLDFIVYYKYEGE